jgi:hypothetical protein
MYLCYARAPLDRSQDEVIAAATLLLDAGADPNAGDLWCGMSTPFTVLTGVFGEGEQGPRRRPRHPFAPALATLLLRRGAHPVDQQALYNRMFGADDSHLELLFAHGLADAGPSPWERRLGEAMETRDQMWQRQVDWAAEHGFAERLSLLARHGVGVSGVELVVLSPRSIPRLCSPAMTGQSTTLTSKRALAPERQRSPPPPRRRRLNWAAPDSQHIGR